MKRDCVWQHRIEELPVKMIGENPSMNTPRSIGAVQVMKILVTAIFATTLSLNGDKEIAYAMVRTTLSHSLGVTITDDCLDHLWIDAVAQW